MRLTPQRLITLGFGLAMSLQAVTAGLAYRNAWRQIDDAAAIQATNQVLVSLTTLLADLRTAESQQRAYILTADRRYRAEYGRAVANLEQHLAEAKSLMADHAGQAARLASVEPIIRERLLNLRLGLDTFHRDGGAKALQVIREDAAVALTERVQAVLHAMAFTETAQLAERAAQAKDTARTTVSLVAVAGGVALLLVALASWVVRRDIRIRQGVEASLQVTTNQLKALIEHLHAGVAVVDETGGLFLLNTELLQLFDLPPDASEWLGKPGSLLWPQLARHAADAASFLARQLSPQRASQAAGTDELRMADGRTLERDCIPITVDGESFGYLWVYRDITGRKETEVILTKALKQVQEATRAKSEFLANMSHELRTPLNSVIGFSEMLDDEMGGPLTEEQRDFVQTIQRNGKHLLALINEILDLAKIEAGRLVLHAEAVDLVGLVGDVVHAMLPLAAKKQIAITLAAETPDAWVQGDPLRLKQVVTNLLTNAVKFSPDGRPITVRVCRAASELQLHVIDQGIGIAAADLGRIFQEFVQLDSSYGKRQEGTGLGLALSKRMIEMQGGRMWVESQLGQGSRFAFALPPLAARPAAVTEGGGSASAPILLVDDDPDSLALLTGTLAPLGKALITAEDGETALALARQTLPALIVLDIRLPRRDGWSVLGTLRSDPQLAQVPVIIVSSDDNEALGLRLGANDYLVKPLDRARLRELVRRYLLRPAQVLIVEDNADFSRYLLQVLRPWGGEIRLVANGAEALAAVAEHRPELVLLDLSMPVMDGWEFLDTVDPTLPIVVITGQPLTETQLGRLTSQVLAVWEKGALDTQTLAGHLQALLDPQAAEPPAQDA
jgi:signal transduction histidine kinase/DNA-binding response OmpR family regulator